jgi:hypothetical protein
MAAGYVLLPIAAFSSPAIRVEKTVATTGHPSVTLSNLRGRVTIRGWSRRMVHAVYILASPRIAVDFDVRPGQGPAQDVHFSTHAIDPTAADQLRTADFTLEIPSGASLEVHDPEGSLQVESIQGDTDLESFGAPIVVTDIGGHLAVRTLTGDISITRAAGRIEATSINGNLRLIDATSSEVRASTNSGDIFYEGNFASGGMYVLSDYSGTMDILCPPQASFELHAKTVRGKLEDNFPIVRSRRFPSALNSGNSLVGTHSTGEATVELRSFSGTIRIRPEP